MAGKTRENPGKREGVLLDWWLGDAKSRGTFWQIYCILARRQKQPKIARGDGRTVECVAIPQKCHPLPRFFRLLTACGS